jgi:hypothetical protein
MEVILCNWQAFFRGMFPIGYPEKNTMKRIAYALLLAGVLAACQRNVAPGRESAKAAQQAGTIEWLGRWIGAWEAMAGSVLKLPPAAAPIMLFYDNEYVYTTSDISAPGGEPFEGPAFFGKKLPWRKTAHHDTLTIPDGQKVPVQLMTFAAPAKEKSVEAFFVMAAPAFWNEAGINSEEVGLEKMLTGVFLHEFAHTRQMNGIGRIITDYERSHRFDFPVGDDMIQAYFSGDSSYVKRFKAEVDLFYQAALSPDEGDVKRLANQGMKMLKERQNQYLVSKNKVLGEMDNVFLTMEGMGQYMMAKYLQSPWGGTIPKAAAIKATRRGKNWWSQEEGLALVLLYERLTPNPDWTILFTDKPADIVTLIEDKLK